MAQLQNSASQIIIDKEDSYGATPGTPVCRNLRGIVTEDIDEQQPLIDSDEIATGEAAYGKPGLGNRNVTGGFTIQVHPEMAEVFLGLLGSIATTGSGPYVNTFSLGSSIPSWVIEKGWTGRFNYFNGYKITSFSMDFPDEGIITASIAGFGAKGTWDTSSIDASPTDPGHSPYSVSSIGTNGFKEGDPLAAYTRLVGFNMEAVRAAEDPSDFYVSGGGIRNAGSTGKLRVTGNIIIQFHDITEINKAIAQTLTGLQVTLTHGDGSGSAGNEKVVFDFEKVYFGKAGPLIENDLGAKITLPFSSVRESSAGPLKITATTPLDYQTMYG